MLQAAGQEGAGMHWEGEEPRGVFDAAAVQVRRGAWQ
jgi:hypothetical protein